MKRRLLFIVSFSLVFCIIFQTNALTASMLTGADTATSSDGEKSDEVEDQSEHEHDPGEWEYSEDGKHIRICVTCGEQTDEEDCVYVAPDSYISANNGTHDIICTVCGGKQNVGCEFTEENILPTQTEAGWTVKTCDLCGYSETAETGAPEADREESRLMGDVDGDGSLSSADARTALRASVSIDKLDNNILPYADVDFDGKVTANDARYILRAALSLEETVRHEFTVTPSKEPTCTEEGTLDCICGYCGFEEMLAIPPVGHISGEKTFSEDGKHTAVCTVCGENVTEKCVYTHPAEYVAQDDGTHARICTVCKGKAIFACEYKEIGTTLPTQTEPGTITRECTVCGYICTEDTDVPESKRKESRLMGDLNGNGSIDSDDARNILRMSVGLGSIDYSTAPLADIDGDGKITADDARNALRFAVALDTVKRHDIKIADTKKATCTDNGSITWNCTYCGFASTLEIPTQGHSWVAATASVAKHCSVCKLTETGWHEFDGKMHYYAADGKAPSGKTLIYSTLNGKKAYWYINNGELDTSYRGTLKYNGSDWIVTSGTGKKVTTEADRTLYRAFGEVAKATKPGMTKEEQLRACFLYAKTTYTECRPRTPHYTGMDWPIIYANDMFVGTGGNCFSYAAAFAYMAKAIGYENVYCCNSGGHGWAEINGLVYDPEWSKTSSTYSFFGVSYETTKNPPYKSAISAGLPWMHIKI